MILIEDLGKRVVNGKNRYFGLYECPECLRVVELRKDTVVRHSKIFDYPKLCSSCANSSAGESRAVHGGVGTHLYKAWQNMVQRATNPKWYPNYEGKGIYSKWQHSFINFKQWALSNGYKNTLSLDRVDNTKGYNPNNCQWITLAENSGKDGKIAVKQFTLDGVYIQTFTSLIDAAASVGLKDGSSITKVMSGERNKAGGFIWEYVE